MADPESYVYKYTHDAPTTRRRVFVSRDAFALRSADREDPWGSLLASAFGPALKALGLSLRLQLPDLGVLVLGRSKADPEEEEPGTNEPKEENLATGASSAALLGPLNAFKQALQAAGMKLGTAYHLENGETRWSPGKVVLRIAGWTAQEPPPWLLGVPEWGVERRLEYAPPGAFVLQVDASRIEPAAVPEILLRRAEVTSAYLVLQGARDASCHHFKEAWHLGTTTIEGVTHRASANVVPAWSRTKGAGVCIAILEPFPIEITHREYQDRVVANLDMLDVRHGRMPAPTTDEAHGTKMAGIALAGGRFEVTGVAPKAGLVAVRIGTSTGSLEEADGFHLAAMRAHVISCSWNVAQVRDQAHEMQDHTRWAMRYALRQGGPSGRGCPIVFAAGNGAKSHRTVNQDPYASFPGVITVTACSIDGKWTDYSNSGRGVWCAFPGGGPELRGIPTTKPGGKMDVIPGRTSGACAGTAGVVALMLAVEPRLRPCDVRRILRRTATKIHRDGGRWRRGHSPVLGYGRVNALRAVRGALRAFPRR